MKRGNNPKRTNIQNKFRRRRDLVQAFSSVLRKRIFQRCLCREVYFHESLGLWWDSLGQLSSNSHDANQSESRFNILNMNGTGLMRVEMNCISTVCKSPDFGGSSPLAPISHRKNNPQNDHLKNLISTPSGDRDGTALNKTFQQNPPYQN